MKVIWEPADIRPGRRYSRPDINKVWMIGYRPVIAQGDKFVSVSLEDGLVTVQMSCEEFAHDLTENGYLPIELCEQR